MYSSHEILVMLALTVNDTWSEQYRHIKEMIAPDYEKGQELIDKYTKLGVDFTTIVDDNYPTKLRTSAVKPPLMIAYKGNINLLNTDKIVGVFGTDNPLVVKNSDKYTIACYKEEIDKARTMFPNAKLIVVLDDLDDLSSINTIDDNIVYITSTLGAENRFILPKASEHILIGGTERCYRDETFIITIALRDCKNIMVFPTKESSWGNNLINSGASLVNTEEDIDFEVFGGYRE